MPNRYQQKKARLIAAVLIQAAIQGDTPFSQLAPLAARMKESQWISVSLAAGQPVADLPARAWCIAILQAVAR